MSGPTIVVIMVCPIAGPIVPRMRSSKKPSMSRLTASTNMNVRIPNPVAVRTSHRHHCLRSARAMAYPARKGPWEIPITKRQRAKPNNFARNTTTAANGQKPRREIALTMSNTRLTFRGGTCFPVTGYSLSICSDSFFNFRNFTNM
jgi:hypothetical protein